MLNPRHENQSQTQHRTRASLNKGELPIKLPTGLWREIRKVVPRKRRRPHLLGGRPKVSQRDAMEAVLFILYTGSAWSTLKFYNSVSGTTAAGFYRRWINDGTFERIADLQIEYKDHKKNDWLWLSQIWRFLKP